jgi:hypothetical protein
MSPLDSDCTQEQKPQTQQDKASCHGVPITGIHKFSSLLTGTVARQLIMLTYMPPTLQVSISVRVTGIAQEFAVLLR